MKSLKLWATQDITNEGWGNNGRAIEKWLAVMYNVSCFCTDRYRHGSTLEFVLYDGWRENYMFWSDRNIELRTMRITNMILCYLILTLISRFFKTRVKTFFLSAARLLLLERPGFKFLRGTRAFRHLLPFNTMGFLKL